jgi:hypothetical protein
MEVDSNADAMSSDRRSPRLRLGPRVEGAPTGCWSRLPVGLLPAVITATAGFGAMTAQSVLGEWDPDLPGHWDYAAGTWGDAVFLPLTVGLLWRWSRQGPVPAPRLLQALGATAGGIVGVLSQAAWYADPEPRPNWVLPAAHDFSSSGWYHAGFLVTTSALTGAMIVSVVYRQRHEAQSPTGMLVTSLFAAATTFAGLVVLDSAPSAGTSSSQATIAVTLTAVVGAAVGLPAASARPRLVLPATLGVAIGVCATAAAFWWRARY